MAFKAGDALDNPAAGSVLVTSQVITVPKRYQIKVTVVSEIPFWAQFVHRAVNGGQRSQILLPVSSLILGPLDLCEMYMHVGDYAEVLVREGVTPDPVPGTVQATIELI